MRLVLLLMTALVAHLAAGASWARTPKACHRCRAACGNAIAECFAATSCPAEPRGKAHRCAIRARRQCRRVTIAGCVSSCRQTGSPVCGTTTPVPAACVPFTSTCPAVSTTPVAVSNPFTTQLEYGFNATTGSPGPGGCCVIDTCAGTTQSKTNAGGVNLSYREIVFLDPFSHLPDNGSINTKIGVSCPIGIPVSVYARSDIYRVNFSVDPRFSLPPAPPEWTAPYVASPGDLSISINSADDPLPSDADNSFTPSTWRLTNQTVSVDKVCAEQQLMQGHATASFIKNDGTSCTVTIYAQGTRVVAQ